MSGYCSANTVQNLRGLINSGCLIASVDTYEFLEKLDPNFEIDYDCSYVTAEDSSGGEVEVPYITGLATWIGKKYVYIHKGLNLCNS